MRAGVRRTVRVPDLYGPSSVGLGLGRSNRECELNTDTHTLHTQKAYREGLPIGLLRKGNEVSPYRCSLYEVTPFSVPILSGSLYWLSLIRGSCS